MAAPTLRERIDLGTVLKVSLVVVLVLTAAWFLNTLTQPTPEEGSIAAMEENPDQYVGERVAMYGEVVETTEDEYIFSDETSEIAVITDNPPENPDSIGMIQGDVERRNGEIVIVETNRH